jgi:hypothetical protein
MSSFPGAPSLLPPLIADSSAFSARLPPLVGSSTVPLALPPGSRVVAEVVQSQTDGQVLLRLGETLLAATLPGDHPVGEQLPMVVLSEPGAQPLLLLTQAPPPGNAAQAQLSSTAQLLGELQREPPGAVRAPAPVWTNPGPDGSAQLAGALAQSVKSSGLFYESHLAAWVQGQLPTQALLGEPQGQLSSLLANLPQAQRDALMQQQPAALTLPQPPAPPAAPGTPHTAAAQAQGAAPAARDANNAATSEANHAANNAASNAASNAAADAPAVASLRARQALDAYGGVQAQLAGGAPAAAQLPAQLQSLVQQQLATLAQGAMVWVGQVWPGQEMQWRVEPDARDAGNADETTARGWTSVIRLDLPRLGSMVATLHLGADQHLRVRLQHGEQAAAELSAQRDALRRSVAAAGLQLDELALQADAAGASQPAAPGTEGASR